MRVPAGFVDGLPVVVKVSWLADEVALTDSFSTEYGLVANIPGDGGSSRYFVPWNQVTYLTQWVAAAPAA